MTSKKARAAIVQPDFRIEPDVATVHNGQPIWLTVCYELIDGRWEGFVSIRPRND